MSNDKVLRPQRLLIVGPGAVGGTVAAWLANSGHEVVLGARTSFSSLRVETADRVLETRPSLVFDPRDVGKVEWILVATKAYEVEATEQWLTLLSEQSAPVAILQNGVEHQSRFASAVPASRMLPVMVDIPAERDAPGRIRQRGQGLMQVPAGPKGAAFARLFDHTPIRVSEVADFTTALWQKLCLNVAGAVPVLVNEPSAAAWREPAAELMRALVAECISVGRCEGAVLDDALIGEVIESYRRAPPDSLNSMHADLLSGRRMEWDARNGVVGRLGRKHAVPTPTSDTVTRLLETIDQRSAET